jgi:catechol 2,3-dioxygenase-like lactoylglutathione lyase family enzyme
MRIRLHEIELFSKDTRASRDFYKKVVGLKVHHEREGLNVFDSGWEGLDFDTSKHHPGKARIGFIVDDLQSFLEHAQKHGIAVGEPEESHLGMRVVRFEDPDGNLVEVQAFTSETPDFVREGYL